MSKKNTTDPYIKACQVLGIKPKPPLKDRSDKDAVSIDAYSRLIVCVRAKNMVDGKVWTPVYDGSEDHYWPYFRLSSGLAIAVTHYGHWSTLTDVGSRLEYRTRQLAIEGAKEFEALYNDFLTL